MPQWNATDFGAVPDGKSNAAPAIQAAIDKCSSSGGGRVFIPAGDYLCGSVELKSNVELHLELGCRLIVSLNPEDIHTHPGVVEEKGSGAGYFLGANGAKNIALTGLGKIDGQGYKVMYDDGLDGGFQESPLMFEGFRPRMTLFVDVEDFLVRDVTFFDSSMWTLHLAGCRHVRVDGIKIFNNTRGPNTDGIDPDCCQDVVISNCIIKTGDDAIVVKATQEMAKRFGPCQDIVITGCTLHSRDSALKIGTETHGDIRNVVFSNCVIEDCSRAVGIWVRDGAVLENIQISHLTGSVKRYADAPTRLHTPGWWGKGEPVFLSACRRKGADNLPGTIRNVSVSNVMLDCEAGLFLCGRDGGRIENILFKDISMRFRRQGTQPTGLFDEQPSERNVYPHSIPALYACGIEGLTVKGWQVRYEKSPWQEAWAHLAELESCSDVLLKEAQGGPAESGIPAIKLADCNGILLADSAIENTQILAEDGSGLELRNIFFKDEPT